MDIRNQRRERLCQVLSILGVVLLFIFGIVNYLGQTFWLAGILWLFSAIILVNIYAHHRKPDVERAVQILNGIMLIFSLILIVTGGTDNTGIFWIYPILAINLSINRLRSAVILAGTYVTCSFLLLYTPLSQELLTTYSDSSSLRFIVTLLFLAAISLMNVRSEEQAYETVEQLHSDEIRELAFYDSLTKLPNRHSFRQNLERQMRRMTDTGQKVGLLYIDLDNFKQVNDSYGHEVGDKLLLQFSEQLQNTLRPNDMITIAHEDKLARLAGDEFAVILPELANSIDAGVVAHRILDLFEGGFEVDGTVHPVYASIGIAIYPDDAGTSDELLHHADAAMYEAKRNGRFGLQFFTNEISEALHARQKIEQGIKLALESKSMLLEYMPMFHCHSLGIMGIEVLVRSNHPDLEGIGPDQFIPVAETTGLIKELDQWVLDNSLRYLKRLQTEHGFTGIMCINTSGAELHNESFPQQVSQLLQKHNIDPSTVELEITETALVLDDKKGIATLRQLGDLGVSLSLDDFGTGYTAFSQLINYPVNCLKIDKSFVKGLFLEGKAQKKIVRIIQHLSEIFELRVVAEGVESEEQLEFLRDSGCDWVQGYYLSQPISENEFIDLLAKPEKNIALPS